MELVPNTMILILIAFLSSAFAQNPSQDGWIGVWKLNVAKSKSQGGPLPKSNTIRIEDLSPGIKVVNDWVNSVDIPSHSEFSAKFDGKEVPVAGLPPGSTVSLNRIDARRLDVVQKSAGVTLSARYAVAGDGKTLTVTQTITNVDGLKLNNTLVFDHQ